METVNQEVVTEIYKAMRKLGAKSDLLGIVGSWGESLPEPQVLIMLRGWNEATPDPVLRGSVLGDFKASADGAIESLQAGFSSFCKKQAAPVLPENNDDLLWQSLAAMEEANDSYRYDDLCAAIRARMLAAAPKQGEPK